MANFSAATADPSSKLPLINFLRGWPHPSLLARTLLQSSASTLFDDPARCMTALCYGPDSGDVDLREQLAKWLTDFYSGIYHPSRPLTSGGADAAIHADRLIITGGASQSLATILTAFTDPTTTLHVWIVAPAYMLAFRIFEDAGFAGRLRAVPEDHEGVDIDFLERKLRAVDAANPVKDAPATTPSRRPHHYRHLIYSVPTFSNPSSRTMSLDRREALVRLARRHDALLVSDDVYDMLYWPALRPSSPGPTAVGDAPPRATLPRLVDIDRHLPRDAAPPHAFGNAVSNGSFSKLLAPGLRTGWVEGAPAVTAALASVGATRSGGAPSQFAACVVAEGLKCGEVQRHVAKLRAAYARRWRTLRDALVELAVGSKVEWVESTVAVDRDEVEGDAVRVDRVAGGYFLCLALPEPLVAAEVAERCKKVNLIIAPGEIFEVPGDNAVERTRFRSLVRLCFAWEDEERLVEGVKRLAEVVKAMLEESKLGGSQPVDDLAQHPDRKIGGFW